MSFPTDAADYPVHLPAHHFHHDPDHHDGALDPPALAAPLPGAEVHHGLRYDKVGYEDLAARAAGGVAVDGEIVATAMQLMKCEAQDQGGGLEHPAHAEAEIAEGGEGEEGEDAAAGGVKREAEDPAEDDGETPNKKKRVKKLALTSHEALTLFAHRGIYVDEETGELRTSSNHKRCDKWDMYNYTRHFTFKVYKKYEAEHLHTEVEQRRLLDAKEAFFRAHPVAEESTLFRRKRRAAKEGRKVLTPEQLRVQERHWMEMWQSAKNELKALRDDLRAEADEEVRAELTADIEGLKRRKGDWGRLLGLSAATPENVSHTF